MEYSETIWDHYEHPRNVGSFSKNDPWVGTGMVGTPEQGDVMKLQIKVNDQGVIEDACFRAYGCGASIACASLVTEWVKGKTLEQARDVKNAQIAEALSLPPIRIFCAVLAEDVVKAAIRDYTTKRGCADAASYLY